MGHDGRDARLHLLGQADPEVEAQRTRDLVTEERAERLARDAAHHLAHRPAEGEAVIAVARAGLPERLLVGETRRHVIPVVGAVVLHLGAHRGHGRGVVEHHARRYMPLAVLGEFRPQLADRRIEVELALRGQHMGAKCRGALGAGEDDGQRIACPRRLGLLVGRAAPQIDDRLTADREADRGADLALAVEVRLEGFGDALEARLARSPDFLGGHFGSGRSKTLRRKRAAS